MNQIYNSVTTATENIETTYLCLHTTGVIMCEVLTVDNDIEEVERVFSPIADCSDPADDSSLFGP